MSESKKFKTIAIIGAMREEITPLLEHFKDYESIEKGGNTFYKITHKSHSIIIAYSKIGKISRRANLCYDDFAFWRGVHYF